MGEGGVDVGRPFISSISLFLELAGSNLVQTLLNHPQVIWDWLLLSGMSGSPQNSSCQNRFVPIFSRTQENISNTQLCFVFVFLNFRFMAKIDHGWPLSFVVMCQHETSHTSLLYLQTVHKVFAIKRVSRYEKIKPFGSKKNKKRDCFSAIILPFNYQSWSTMPYEFYLEGLSSVWAKLEPARS